MNLRLIMDEKEALYKKILFIILLVVIFVSILGTWTILSYIDNVSSLKDPIQGRVISQLPNVKQDSGAIISVTVVQPEDPQNNKRGNLNEGSIQ